MRRLLAFLIAALTCLPFSKAQEESGNACACPCEGSEKLLGFILHTDLCAADYISPMTNPVYFEDPRNLSEVRFIFAHHAVPVIAPLAGGNIQFLAAQARAKITDRLSIVAAKDGFFWFSENLPFAPNDGWSDISAGLKYQLYADCNYDRILSVGGAYEAPWGSTRSFQGNGDGQFNLYGTGGMRVGERSHLLGTMGWKIPADGFSNSEFMYGSIHFDHRLPNRNLYLFTEFNWFHYLADGGRLPGLGIEGGDLFNFGSGGVQGNDIVTGALGAKYKPTQRQEIGLAWEVPLTDRRDVLEYRITMDWIFRY